MDSVETKGKSVDEAIFNGLNELGLGIDEVEIEIINEGGKGFFGIGKNAVVRLTKKSEETLAAEETFKEAHSGDKPKEYRRERDDRRERREREEYVPKKEIVPGDSAAEVFINELIKKMGLNALAGITEENGKNVNIEIAGDDTAVLIGRRGDTLDAIQYLTGLVVNKGSDEYTKIMVDAENYRRKREITLEKLARRLANNVIKSGKPITLEPMNPYERRIMHAALQSNPKVETYSEGVDPKRCVVIRKKRRHEKTEEN